MMTVPHATLNDFEAALKDAAPDAKVGFLSPLGASGAGFHVVEVKVAEVRSLDCGAQKSHWQELQIQLLDGDDGKGLSIGKMRGILEKTRESFDLEKDVELVVEFSPNNQILSKHYVSQALDVDGDISVSLIPAQAVCKPSLAWEKAMGKPCC